MRSSTEASTFGGWPPAQSKAKTSDVNSWPRGTAAKRKFIGVPERRIVNDGLRASAPAKLTFT